MSWSTLGIELLVSAVVSTLWVWVFYSGIPQRKLKVHGPPPLRSIEETPFIWLLTTFLMAAVFVLGDVAIVVSPNAYRLFLFFLRVLGLQVVQIVIGLGTIAFGLGAYWFKVRNQLAYGFVEILFAGAAGVVTAKQMTRTTGLAGSIATLIGAVYVVSRGVSNFVDGLEKRRVSKMAEEHA